MSEPKVNPVVLLDVSGKSEKLSVKRHFKPICSQCTLSLPPENIRKPYGFLMFSGGTEKVHWEQMA